MGNKTGHTFAKYVSVCGVAVALMAAACERTASWDSEIEQNYLNSCKLTSGGLAEMCSCQLSELKKKWTQEKFLDMEQKIMASDPAALQEFLSVIGTCST